MRYPSFTEYTDALQLDLGVALSDPLLARGTLGTYGPGLPIARGGTFAVTFEVAVDGRRYALRCFLREIDALPSRYAAISRLLARIDSPHFVAFEFQPQGITTWSGTYPVVRMDWAPGQNLARFVAAHRDDLVELRRVQAALRDLAAHLHANDIAHGDLQPTNIIVGDDGTLRLVDYDGLFVPQLARLRSADLGHRNFRHPGRRARHFGPVLDAFSFIVLDVALEALCRRPELWELTGSGEDAFILRAADFLDPGNSPAFSLLSQVAGLEERVRHLAAICLSPFNRIPSFAEFLAGSSIPAVRVIFAQNPASAQRRPYAAPQPIVEAADFARCCSHVGDRVELIGRIVRVEPIRTPVAGAAGLRVEFGERGHDMCCLRITPEALASLDELPDELWSGRWISATGLLEPVSSGRNAALRQKDVSITITDRTQLLPLTEAEAQYRLGEQGGRTDLAPERTAGVATDPIHVGTPAPVQAASLLPQTEPVVAPGNAPVAALRTEPIVRPPVESQPVQPPAPRTEPRPAVTAPMPRPPPRARRRPRWLAAVVVGALVIGAVAMLSIPREAESPPKPPPATAAPEPVAGDEPGPVPAAVPVEFIASADVDPETVSIETGAGPLAIGSAADGVPASIVTLGGEMIPGLRDDRLEFAHLARYTDRDVLVGFATCRGTAPPCGRKQPFWLELRPGSAAVVRQVPGLWLGGGPGPVTASGDGVRIDLGTWNGERRLATLTAAGSVVVERQPQPVRALARADCAVVVRALESCAASRDCGSFSGSAQRIPALQWARLERIHHESTGFDSAAFRNLCTTSCRLGLTPSPQLIRREACSGAQPGQWSDASATTALLR